MTNSEPLRLDNSHLVSRIVYESKPNVFHVDLSAVSNDPDFPNMIETCYGNEQPFKLYKKMYNKHDNMHIATYKQLYSRATLFVYIG